MMFISFFFTATPLQNSVDDLFSLFKYLRFAPICERAEWKRLISEAGEAGLKRLRVC